MERPMNHVVAICAFSFSVTVMLILHVRHRRPELPAKA
jgi:hypothetical protein